MKKVMLVEDEELILQGIFNIIDWNALGLEVVHMAHNGQEALEMWEKEPVDIAVSDITMPVMDGLTLLRVLREKEEKVRFIILSGYDEFEYARTAIRLGVESYILKPINEEELERQLKETVEKLDEMYKEKIKYIDEKTQWMHFLSGKTEAGGYAEYAGILDIPSQTERFYAAVMKWRLDELKENRITDVIVTLKKQEPGLRLVHLLPDSLLMILVDPGLDEEQALEYFAGIQNRIESEFGIFTFICVGPAFEQFEQLPEVYGAAMKMQIGRAHV